MSYIHVELDYCHHRELPYVYFYDYRWGRTSIHYGIEEIVKEIKRKPRLAFQLCDLHNYNNLEKGLTLEGLMRQAKVSYIRCFNDSLVLHRIRNFK